MTTRANRELAERIQSVIPSTKFVDTSMRGLMIEAIQRFRPDFDPSGKSDEYLRGSVEVLLDSYDAANSPTQHERELARRVQENRKALTGVSR